MVCADPPRRFGEGHVEGPLTGLKVIDVSNYIAGPWCTRLLAGFGADVIKVERPAGDPIRHWGPFRDDVPDPEAGALHLYLNQGKRSVTIDLESEPGRRAFRELLAGADVLVESYRPGTMARWGLGYADLAEELPGLLYVSVTDFGQDGPYSELAAWEITTYALGGLMHITGEPDREPLKNGGFVGSYGAGHNAFDATLVGLWERGSSGLGQQIDVSIHECVASLLEFTDMAWVYQGEVWPRSGNGARAAWGVYPAADGYVGIVSGPPRRWAMIPKLMESEELASPRYLEAGATSTLRDEIDALMLPWLVTHEKEEIYHRGQALGMPFGFVATPADFFKSEQLAYREFFEEIDHPVAGPARYPTMAARFSDGLWSLGRAPLLGEHNDEVLSTLPGGPPERGGASEPQPAVRPHPVEVRPVAVTEGVYPLRGLSGEFSEDRSRRGPLSDVAVLDLSMVWAGPYATKLMADLGASIVKVEVNSHLDSVRGLALAQPGGAIGLYANRETAGEPWNRSGYFNKLNRGKFDLCMNILEPEGRAVLHELIEKADVVIENFGGGVFERMGYGRAVLEELNPDVVFVSMPPSGNGGPEAKYVGYGVAIEQLGGIVGRTGYAGDIPLKSGINYGDPIAGIHAMGYIMTALHHRRRTGRGSYIDLSQREAAICWLGDEVVEYELTGDEPERIGNRDEFMAPSGVYRCAGNDAWLAVVAGSTEEWRALAGAIGRADLAEDAELATLPGRRARHDELDAAITEWTETRDRDVAMSELQSAGVAAGVVAENRRVIEDPHLQARGFWPTVNHKSVGPHLVSGIPWHFSRTPGEIRRAAPQLGQHTDYVLRELLGKSDEEIEVLRASGVLENTPVEVLELRARQAQEASGA
jgi:crotonobetainyl-CoA:carnitine CoA-transferase CaiB-like acyl-CoA transferase